MAYSGNSKEAHVAGQSEGGREERGPAGRGERKPDHDRPVG